MTPEEKELAILKEKMRKLELENGILKKQSTSVQETIGKFGQIPIYRRDYYPVDLMCQLLQVSRSSFYYWRKYPTGKRFEMKQVLKTKIKSAYFDNKGLYGSPRLAVEITCSGTPVSRTTVALHMKEMDLKSKTRGKFKVTTDSTHKKPICDNFLDRQFNSSAPTMT